VPAYICNMVTPIRKVASRRTPTDAGDHARDRRKIGPFVPDLRNRRH